jgi:hypothetical protein
MTISANDLWWIIPILVWELVWKGLALWRSAQKEQSIWFVALLVLNTAGILPIIYLLTNPKKSSSRN